MPDTMPDTTLPPDTMPDTGAGNMTMTGTVLIHI